MKSMNVFCLYVWVMTMIGSMGLSALSYSGGRLVVSLCSFVLCLVSIFCGMFTSLIIERKRVSLVKSEVSDGMATFEKQKEMTLRIARLVADRVSDRLVAKLSALYNDEQREAVFGDADGIVEEELAAIQEAMEGIEVNFDKIA